MFPLLLLLEYYATGSVAPILQLSPADKSRNFPHDVYPFPHGPEKDPSFCIQLKRTCDDWVSDSDRSGLSSSSLLLSLFKRQVVTFGSVTVLPSPT